MSEDNSKNSQSSSKIITLLKLDLFASLKHIKCDKKHPNTL